MLQRNNKIPVKKKKKKNNKIMKENVKNINLELD
jgi:hypothetical protein